MNDKKQIEELASLMADCNTTCDECFEKYESVMTMKIKEREKYCQVYACAQRAVEQGYRKLPEDAIILTKEEYIDLSQNYVKEQKEQAVKEFAEKIKMAFYYEFDEIIPSIISDKIDELLKEYEK